MADVLIFIIPCAAVSALAYVMGAAMGYVEGRSMRHWRRCVMTERPDQRYPLTWPAAAPWTAEQKAECKSAMQRIREREAGKPEAAKDGDA